jgi:lysyl oxidase
LRTALLALLLPVLVASAGASPTSLPDLDQATPLGVSVVERHGRVLLVFGSAVDNVGPGPLVVEGRRVGGVMRARQVVGDHTYPLRTPLRYVRSETHQHWHLVAFERYELRRSGALVGRDRKTGFCLNDAYETRALNRVPRWTGECGRGRPGARTVREGISPGFGDDYVPEKEGQSIDVTGLPPGRYVLVHRANPERTLRERSYANNTASVSIELRGRRVRVLARCPDSATCGT